MIYFNALFSCSAMAVSPEYLQMFMPPFPSPVVIQPSCKFDSFNFSYNLISPSLYFLIKFMVDIVGCSYFKQESGINIF